MRVKNLRFFRCIDVFKITISRLPAAEEHLFCSSAAGRHTSIQAPFWGLSVQARAGFLPRQLLDCTKQMHYASIEDSEGTVLPRRLRTWDQELPMNRDGSSRVRKTPLAACSPHAGSAGKARAYHPI